MQHTTIYALIEWLRAQLADDERLAQAVTPGPWRYNPTKVNSITREESVFAGPAGLTATTVASTGPCDDPQSMADAWFIAAWDPSRVLAEVQAKRAIIKRQFVYLAKIDGEWGDGCNAERIEAGQCPVMQDVGLFDLLLALAQPYAGREGWQDEWNVTG